MRLRPSESPRLGKRLKRALRYGLIRAALGAVAALPVRLASRVGAAFGGLAFLLARGERAKAQSSLRVAFPERSEGEQRTLALDCFRHLGACAFELACIRQIDRRIEEWVHWPEQDRAVLDAALARGRGVVFVTGHVGNWELLARRVGLAGYRAQSIAKETPDERLTGLIERFRAEGRVGSIWRGHEGAAKQMLRALKAGEMLGLLIDQDTRVQSLFVPFFGVPAATPRAAADLALRTGAAVVVGFCTRRPGGGYGIRMTELAPPSSGNREADALALTARLSLEIEAAIRQAPAQWVWMHQRWKTRPSGVG